MASSISPLVLSVSMHTVVVCIYSLADKVVWEIYTLSATMSATAVF